MRIKVIDLDGAVATQDAVAAGVDRHGGDVLLAHDLAPRLRLLANGEAAHTLARRLGPAGQGELCFYGSGDFHHLTALLVARLDEPVCVIHFDNHPDWVRLPRSLNCGSWVSRALEQPNVARVVTLGPCSTDILAPQFKGADLAALRSGRLEVRPHTSAATFYAGAGFEAPGVSATSGLGRGGLVWQGLDGGPWAEVIAEIAARLPPLPLWITLDKDVLRPQEAVTNWDQGQLSLDQVLEAISIFAAHRPVRGMDVCGDYSPAGHNGLVRDLLARLDQAQRPEPLADPVPVNDAANRRIVAHMEAILQ